MDKGKIEIYNISDLNNITLIKELSAQKQWINAIVIYQLGIKTILASISWDPTLCMYDISDLSNSDPKNQLTNHEKLFNSMVIFQKDSKTTFIAADNSIIYFYDLEKLKHVFNCKNTVKQTLFLIAYAQSTQDKPLDLIRAPHLCPVFDSLDPLFQKHMKQSGTIKLPLSYWIEDYNDLFITAAIGSAAAFCYWWCKK